MAGPLCARGALASGKEVRRSRPNVWQALRWSQSCPRTGGALYARRQTTIEREGAQEQDLLRAPTNDFVSSKPLRYAANRPAELDGQEWLFNWIATGVGSAGDRSAYTLIRVV